MLKATCLIVWTVNSISEFLEEDPVLLEAAKKVYADEFKEHCELLKDLFEGVSEKEKFQSFIDEFLSDNEYDSFIAVMDGFAKSKGYKSYFCDVAYNDNDGYSYSLSIVQVIPESKEDLEELIYVYMQTKGQEDLAEIISHKVLRKIGEK